MLTSPRNHPGTDKLLEIRVFGAEDPERREPVGRPRDNLNWMISAVAIELPNLCVTATPQL